MNQCMEQMQLALLRLRRALSSSLEAGNRRFRLGLRRCPRLIAEESGEFGLSSLIGVAIGLIIAAFVLIPGVRDFAGRIIADMDSWWKSSVSSQVFPK